MANTKSAQKAYRQDEKRRQVNLARSSALKTAVKKLMIATEQALPAHELDKMLRAVAAHLARARSKKVIKANAASRTLSRLTLRVNRALSMPIHRAL